MAVLPLLLTVVVVVAAVVVVLAIVVVVATLVVVVVPLGTAFQPRLVQFALVALPSTSKVGFSLKLCASNDVPAFHSA